METSSASLGDVYRGEERCKDERGFLQSHAYRNTALPKAKACSPHTASVAQANAKAPPESIGNPHHDLLLAPNLVKRL